MKPDDQELLTDATGPARCLRLICEKASIFKFEVAQLLEVRRETVSRWQDNRTRPHPHLARRLFELASIAEKLAAVLGPMEARRWLYSPQPPSGVAPAELIKQGRCSEVLMLADELCAARQA